MYTDGLETSYYSAYGGTAHFPLLYTMIRLTIPFYFFKEYRLRYEAINNYGERGCESLLFLILSPSQDSNDITSISCPQKWVQCSDILCLSSEPDYSIPRSCCFLLIPLCLLSRLIRPMFNLQEILIPLIPKIRSLSEGTIWLSEDWTINSTRLTLSLPFFLQFLEALCLWIWTESLFYFFRTRFNKYRRHRFFASDFCYESFEFSFATITCAQA